MAVQRTPPIIIDPSDPAPDPCKSAAFIFVHGFGDDAEGVEPIVRQFQAAGKLPHMFWVLPNALEVHDVMTTAWYMPTRLPSFPPSRPELGEDEDEQGIMSSRDYLVSLIDDLVAKGVPAERIVLGGFSQGHAIALFTGLTSSKYSGKLAGLVGLSGYLPLIEKIPRLREAAALPDKANEQVHVFIARGTGDVLVPKRYLTLCSNALLSCGVHREHLTMKEYEGMGHIMAGAELRDLCTWLERVVPAMQ